MSNGRRWMRRSCAIAVAGVLALSAAPSALATCPGDVDGSGSVGFDDVVAVLAAWGSCPGCPADLDGNDVVEFDDLLGVLAAWGPCPGFDAVRIPLAGRPLAAAPFADHALVFTEGRPVHIAFDPRHLGGATPTCDVYVTPARSESAWGLDPTLTDVRGAAQTIVFDGATISDNTHVLTDSTSLSGDGGLDVGQRYDLVCDCNQNGVLDGADFIDGASNVPGFAVTETLTQPGPLSVVTVEHLVAVGQVTGGFRNQRISYPADIAQLGQLPLVTISHGNGHNYAWYDYLTTHLASYGYVVMSHANDTMPGIETASTTTWQHTDAFIDELALIDGGVLEGHVDTSQIAWIGHSRGGEGVVRAYTRVRTGLVTPTHYTAEDVRIVSSIAPNNALGSGQSEPADVVYHLLWGAADGDINGQGVGTWSFAIFERATGWAYSTYVHGADHNDFNCCGFNDFQGPGGTEIGRPEAQRIAQSDYLLLLAHHLRADPVAGAWLRRQDAIYTPPGVNSSTVLVRDRREPLDDDVRMVDDYQDGTDLMTSSSGGAVTLAVADALEALMQDTLIGYAWNPADAMNGMSRNGNGDDAHGAILGWDSGGGSVTYDLVPGQRDVSSFDVLSFRACQQSQHPRTIAELGELSFVVELEDGTGATSAIDFGAYGGGIEELYQRTGGWQNEFELVRVALDAFLIVNPDLDLTDIAALRFRFGPGFGSAQGQIGLDDVRFVRDRVPDPAGVLRLSLTDEPLALVAPNAPAPFDVQLRGPVEDALPETLTLHVVVDGGAEQTFAAVPNGDDRYTLTLPALACASDVTYWITMDTTDGATLALPTDAPVERFAVEIGVVVPLLSFDFESTSGWTTENVAVTGGAWERGVPAGNGDRGDPTQDGDGSGACWLTENGPDNTDVDGGPTRLISPPLALASTPDVRLAYDRWFYNDDLDEDRMTVEISNDNGATWVTIESVPGEAGWQRREFIVADYVTPTDLVRLRISAVDNPNNSVTEAGFDGVLFFVVECN